MKVVCISDTHTLTDKLIIPEGDVLIHAGDALGQGTLPEFARFAQWMGSLPHKFKLYVPGNHDFVVQRDMALCRRMLEENSTRMLVDEPAGIKGVKLYGSPWVPNLEGWAFYGDHLTLVRRFGAIPDDTGVLITHAPPRGISDEPSSTHVGSTELRQRVDELQHLRLHVFGHIHEGYGMYEDIPTKTEKRMARQFVNASICTRAYVPSNKPIVVEI